MPACFVFAMTARESGKFNALRTLAGKAQWQAVAGGGPTNEQAGRRKWQSGQKIIIRLHSCF